MKIWPNFTLKMSTLSIKLSPILTFSELQIFKQWLRVNFYCRTVCVYYAPPRGIKRWCCLTSVWRLTSVVYIRSAGGVCGRPDGWRVLADRARLGQPGSRLPLRASVAGLGGGISWRPPAYSVFLTKSSGEFKAETLLTCSTNRCTSCISQRQSVDNGQCRNVAVTTTIRLRLDARSTAIRLLLKCHLGPNDVDLTRDP